MDRRRRPALHRPGTTQPAKPSPVHANRGAKFLLYVVVAMFIVGASSYFISYPFGSNPTNAAAAMAARLVRQRITDATVGQLKRTLIVRYPRIRVARVLTARQVLWLFRLPMAIGQALTRCAIAIFFIQTLYTKVFPWLRHFGTSV